jgi:8-oxo-dGTP pyrophosphatase MutT (NUDIX family)
MSQTLTALDIFGQTHIAPVSEFKFRISAYGILIVDHKILLQQNPNNHLYNLPGGGVEVGESGAAAVKREFLEETGYTVSVNELIDTDFSLFTYDGYFFHNLLLFYKAVKSSEQIIDPTDPEDSLGAQFFDLANINFDIIQPIYHNIIKRHL